MDSAEQFSLHQQSSYLLLYQISLIQISGMKQKQNDKTIVKRLWTKEEDELLKVIVSKHTNYKWAQISDEFNQSISALKLTQTLARTNKQCRERWQNHLNPKLNNNGEWSREEHEELFDLFFDNSHQWCLIGSKLEEKGFLRRGDNNIKNYFYSSIKRASKKINEAIRENNKGIKKIKSLLYNYNEKYSYKKRMSLQRQILSLSKLPNQENNSSHEFKHQENDFDCHLASEQPKQQNFRIIKELDPKIINKIFQILEQKNERKFTSGNIDVANINKVCSKMISYLKNYDSLKNSDLIQLSTQILDISRQYKRKAVKPTAERGPEQCQEQDKMMHSKSRDQDDVQLLQAQSSQERGPIQSNSKRIDQPNNNKEIKANSNIQVANEGFNYSKVAFVNNPFFSSGQQIKNKDENEKKQGNNLFFNQLFGDYPKSYYLEQSNEYMLGSNPDFVRNSLNDPFSNPMFNNRQLNESYNYVYPIKENDLLKSISQEYSMSMRKEHNPQNFTSRGQFSFIDTFKVVNPLPNNSNDYQFEFDFGNSFIPPSFKNSDTDQGLFFSQLIKKSKPSYSLLSNQSHSKTNKKSLQHRDRLGQLQFGMTAFDNLMQSQNLLHRSWGYSEIKPDINRNGLSNSNNFEQMRKESGMQMMLKYSNFTPYEKPTNQ